MAGRRDSVKPPRNSSLGPRYSLAGPGRPSISRRSSVIYGKGSQPRQDPRPINDKAFQTFSMRVLVEYLTTHGYSFPISPKLLPSGKDIHNMIEFLFLQLDPKFQLGKLEDDVPHFFRLQGYPFQISKSALYAAGSPHSWPNLLAALAWLVDLLNRYETEAPEEAEELEGDGIWGYLCQGYSCFLKGDDAGIEDLDEQASLQFSQDMTEARREAELIAEKIVEVAGKLEQLQSEPDPLVALETKKPMLLSDCVKFQSYIQNLTSSKLGHQKKIEQHMQQLDSKKAELESLVVENQSLTERIAIQTFKVEDIDKMSREVARVSEDLLSASVSRKQKEKETWDLEVLVSKTLKKLENVALELNHAMKRFKVFNGAGNLFEIHLNPRGETAQDMIGVDIKQTIRPHLSTMLDEMEKSARQKWKESADVLKEISAKEDALKEKQAGNSQLESRTKELEGVCKKRQEKLDSIVLAIQVIRKQIDGSEEKLKARVLESAERAEAARRELEQTEVLCENEVQHEVSEVIAMSEAVAGYLERIHAKNVAFRAEVDKLKLEVSANYVQTLKCSILHSSLVET